MAEVQITGETLDNLAAEVGDLLRGLVTRGTDDATSDARPRRTEDRRCRRSRGVRLRRVAIRARKQCQRRWHGPAPAGILQLVRIVHGQRRPWLAGRRRHRFRHGVHRIDRRRSSGLGVPAVRCRQGPGRPALPTTRFRDRAAPHVPGRPVSSVAVVVGPPSDRGTRADAAIRVALVCMPFYGASRPAIQLGLLQGLARADGHECDTFHLNVELARALGAAGTRRSVTTGAT